MRSGSLWVSLAALAVLALAFGSCTSGYDGPMGAVKGDLDGQASLGVFMDVTDMHAEKRTFWDLECQSEPAFVQDPGDPAPTPIAFYEYITEGPTVTTLTVEGTLEITNGGSGDAPVESIIINLQSKETGPFETLTSVGCGDPENMLCNASGPNKVYIANEGGWLELYFDPPGFAGPDVCGDLPFTIAVGETVDMVYRAVFVIDPFDLEEGDHARIEALVTFSNAGDRGQGGASCDNPFEEGDYIRTIASRVSGQMPPIYEFNQSVEFCKEITSPADPTIVVIDGFTIDTADRRYILCADDLPGPVPADGSADFCCEIMASGEEGTQTLFTVSGTAECGQREGRTFVENTGTLTGPDDQIGITGSPAICQIAFACGNGGGGGGIEPGDYCTQTQGGWGSRCRGNNTGCLRDEYFDQVFPAGLVVGGGFTITLSNSQAVEAYLPAGGTADVLTQDHVNPLDTEAGVFGGQVVALKLNVEFDAAGFGKDGPDHNACGGALLSELVIQWGKFEDMTVGGLLALAEEVLGGDTDRLFNVYGASISDLNNAVSAVNECFVDCDRVCGFLDCP